MKVCKYKCVMDINSLKELFVIYILKVSCKTLATYIKQDQATVDTVFKMVAQQWLDNPARTAMYFYWIISVSM